jgi:hypothetical protein
MSAYAKYVHYSNSVYPVNEAAFVVQVSPQSGTFQVAKEKKKH